MTMKRHFVQIWMLFSGAHKKWLRLVTKCLHCSNPANRWVREILIRRNYRLLIAKDARRIPCRASSRSLFQFTSSGMCPSAPDPVVHLSDLQQSTVHSPTPRKYVLMTSQWSVVIYFGLPSSSMCL
ncbi:uncharacterized protein LOC111332204 isoform X1 [Stylophora pistillata]|uniref:uncharacterized protein LOC111332204 isoform X1 n=1 Tax=Stylophora pistillata TaxID=50429 RepID=UPI000C043794|nr:uncharacterized protein LOC111332204 isoform X1 [Stylophora pistillata]XP_022793234.1 uncharacterized protein LOC111332204 isoform X1 [Stylophora pistillata]